MSERVWGIASYTLAGAAALGAGSYIAWRCNVEGATIAAWVQAIGSIAAIVGSFGLARSQANRESCNRLRDAAEKAASAGDIIVAIGIDTMHAIAASGRLIHEHKAGGIFTAESDHLEDAQRSLSAVLARDHPPSMTIPLLKLKRLVTYSERALRQRHGKKMTMSEATLQSAQSRTDDARSSLQELRIARNKLRRRANE